MIKTEIYTSKLSNPDIQSAQFEEEEGTSKEKVTFGLVKLSSNVSFSFVLVWSRSVSVLSVNESNKSSVIILV